MIGGFLGLISAVVLTVFEPVDLGDGVAAIRRVPRRSLITRPAIFSMPLGFIGCWLFSVLDRSRAAKLEEQSFEAQYIRSQTGIGAEGAASH